MLHFLVFLVAEDLEVVVVVVDHRKALASIWLGCLIHSRWFPLVDLVPMSLFLHLKAARARSRYTLDCIQRQFLLDRM